MRLDNPLLVRWEYASEERLAKRSRMIRELTRGDDPEETAFQAVAELRPKRLLDVGCGPGQLTERFARELGADVKAVDVSPRMVELTRGRGIDARVGDVEELPFRDGEFDCVFAGWVLYHVPGLERGIAECARVLTSGGRLVASTYDEDNLGELWRRIEGVGPRTPLSFGRSNGRELLQRRFALVEQRDVESTVVFPDTASVREMVAATIDRAHLAPHVPELAGPLEATSRHAVFVAVKQ